MKIYVVSDIASGFLDFMFSHRNVTVLSVVAFGCLTMVWFIWICYKEPKP